MNANEVMLECPVTLRPDDTVADAMVRASTADVDILPIVDDTGHYIGSVAKTVLVDNAPGTTQSVQDLCCTDALLCKPEFPLEEFAHDAESAIPHRTIVVVDDAGQFCGVVPWVHWAVDEAKVQSGHPRSPLEVRSYSMHITWRCLDCGELSFRKSGTPVECPSCGAGPDSFALYTED